MNLSDVMNEVAQRMDAITGLRVTPYPPATILAPAGFVSYPERVEFDETYGRGQDMIQQLPVVLVVGRATERSARDTASEWASGSGPKSVKAALDGDDFQSCDDVTVTACDFDVINIGGVEYLAAVFVLDIAGSGE
ncbi:MAG: hypothetical protein JXA67_20335 [Micromonosporaceae bacterium]|nr:hypothetical protein [Micromonosporaceae bacterium]